MLVMLVILKNQFIELIQGPGAKVIIFVKKKNKKKQSQVWPFFNHMALILKVFDLVPFPHGLGKICIFI